jgi:transmembrane sensor
MEKTDIKDFALLFEKYNKGTLTGNEEKKFFDIISDKENEILVKEFILSRLNVFEPDDNLSEHFDSEKVLLKIFSDLRFSDKAFYQHYKLVGKENNTRKIILKVIGIAASLVITFLFGNFFRLTTDRTRSETRSAVTFNVIRAPFGSRSEITLPDGSTVLLNAGSYLKYRNDFNVTNRELSLNGEAYFKVAKNAELPLHVNAGNLNILAVGTEFNIKAYDEEKIIETTLVEGSVKITLGNDTEEKDGFIKLNPNQKAIYVKKTKSFTLDSIELVNTEELKPVRTRYENVLIAPKVNVDEVAAWTTGKLVIRGDKLESLCLKLQRKYDVTFIFDDEEIKKYRFSGTLLDETLEQVLSAIKLTAPITFTVSGKIVYLNADTKELNGFSRHLR